MSAAEQARPGVAVDLIDLDALAAPPSAQLAVRRPRATVVVVPGEVLRPWVSPLDGGGHALRGGVVTDPVQIAAIRARTEYHSQPFWRRWTTPRPAGW